MPLKATLKWHLFKQYAEIVGQTAYWRPDGTRWVSHQLTAIDVHLCNLPVMLTFSNEQVDTPCNATMKKEKARIEGIHKNASDLKLLVHQALRNDIMAYSVSCSLTLEKLALLMPETIMTIQSTLSTLAIISDVLEKEGQQALQRTDLFPTLNKKVIPMLNTDEDAPVLNEMRL